MEQHQLRVESGPVLLDQGREFEKCHGVTAPAPALGPVAEKPPGSSPSTQSAQQLVDFVTRGNVVFRRDIEQACH